MKNFFLFIIILVPWFLSSVLFRDCLGYFDTINTPFFTLPKQLYGIVWGIIYILISISVYKIYQNNRIKDVKNYNLILLINYLFNQLYLYLFFCLKNPLLGLIDCLLIFISSLYLYIETRDLNKDYSKYLKPYIIFNIYATLLSITIYFMNL